MKKWLKERKEYLIILLGFIIGAFLSYNIFVGVFYSFIICAVIFTVLTILGGKK